MTPPLIIRRVTVPALVVSALAALALSGCAGDTKTNGLEKLPARTAQQKALAALRSASSAHVKGTSLLAGNPAQVDVRFNGRSSTGVIAAEGVQFAFTRIEDITYIKASRRTLKQFGAPAPVRRIAAERWLRLASDQVTLSGISLAELGDQLAKNESPLDPHVAQETLDGNRVVVVTQQNGSKLYIANTGPAYPLRGDYKGQAAGRFDFTEFGADFRVTAPKHPLDASNIGDRE
jgi:hypothetical protein